MNYFIFFLFLKKYFYCLTPPPPSSSSSSSSSPELGGIFGCRWGSEPGALVMAASATRASICSTAIGASNYHRQVGARMLVPLFIAHNRTSYSSAGENAGQAAAIFATRLRLERLAPQFVAGRRCGFLIGLAPENHAGNEYNKNGLDGYRRWIASCGSRRCDAFHRLVH